MYHIKNLSTINGVLRPGIVHRLDKDTGGLIIVAKNDNSHKKLSEQLKDKTLNREYKALIKGRIKDVIINADGENIFPDELEIYFSKIPNINKLCVVGVRKENSTDEKAVCKMLDKTPREVITAYFIFATHPATMAVPANISNIIIKHQPELWLWSHNRWCKWECI
jgi:acyl-CoA synthetase (AMP-forming)/AMP-acid ligase II